MPPHDSSRGTHAHRPQDAALRKREESLMWGVISRDGFFEMARLVQPSLRTDVDVLVRVTRVAVNRGEFSFDWVESEAVGWDAVGVVVESATPEIRVGERVATWGFSGAWAQFRRMSLANLALVPSEVSDDVAAALPVVGITALRSLRVLALSRGETVAITGARGGVGHVAVQIARQLGLNVVPITREAIADGMDFDGLIDVVGGRQLSSLLPRIRNGGSVVSVGNASGAELKVDTVDLASRRVAFHQFRDYRDAGADLAELLRMVKRGLLVIDTHDGGSWTRLTRESRASILGRGKTTFSVSSLGITSSCS